MIDLVITQTDMAILKERLLNKDTEVCAILFTKNARGAGGDLRVLVREVCFPEPGDYLKQTATVAVLSPDCVAQVTKKARTDKSGLVFVHSHLGTSAPEFSPTDDRGELLLAEFLARRIPGLPHIALVLSLGGASCRLVGAREQTKVTVVGTLLTELTGSQEARLEAYGMYDRQVRAFGIEGQRRLGELRIAIVGLGGTGSLVAQQLAHLGVKKFVLVDPDVIEESNLNRVVGAFHRDIGTPKVEVARRQIVEVSPDANVEVIQGNVVLQSVALKLTAVDFIFGCTDSHGSRSVLQQIAYQYYIPAIDMGTVIVVREGRITHITGRSQLLSPGQACLHCCRLINSAQVRADLMTEFERQQDPYLTGVHEPAPAVIGINSTVASLSITMFLSVVLGVPGDARNQVYDGIRGTVRSVEFGRESDCYVCSPSGLLGHAASRKLLAREG